MRTYFFATLIVLVIFIPFLYFFWKPGLHMWWVLGPLAVVGLFDVFQKKRSVLRNFPIIGHFRYIFEAIRPEINQYFVESNTDGQPFSREQRSVVYRRAKRNLDTIPFGTQKNVYEQGYEWVNHSIIPKEVGEDLRLQVGNLQCDKPYSASLLNVAAMSYGSLSANAIEALNGGAKLGNFAHNTGEGGCSPYHLKPGGDLIWQIGTGYFGCRTSNGKFSPERFAEISKIKNIKMIEIKISQGAKPGHGGILPAAKVTKEISEIRGVPMGVDIISPPGHSAFNNPIELLEFVQTLRKLSDGKPIGFKMCMGKRREFMAICKAMRETQIFPDFIAIDGAEGGTGAAPVEFSNSIGCPLREGIIFSHNCLVGFDIRKHIKLIASGRMMTGFDMVTRMAMGADLIYSARAMMFALGCIQALRCNTNKCPVGVATQDKALVRGLDVNDKTYRIFNYHKDTMQSFAHILGAMGLESPRDLIPAHVQKRTGLGKVFHYEQIYNFLKPGDLLKEEVPQPYFHSFQNSCANTFDVVR